MNLALILKVGILIVLMEVVNGEEEEISAWKVKPVESAHYSPTHHKILEKEKLEIVAKQRSDKSKRHITQIEDLEPELEDYYKAIIDLDAREREQANSPTSFQTQNNQFNDHRQQHQSNYHSQQYNWNQNPSGLQNQKGQQHQGNEAQSHQHVPSYDPEGNPSANQGNGHFNNPHNSHQNSQSRVQHGNTGSEHQNQQNMRNRQEVEERLQNEVLRKINLRQQAEREAEEAQNRHKPLQEEPPRKTMWEMEAEDNIHQQALKHKIENQERLNHPAHLGSRENYAQKNPSYGKPLPGYYDRALDRMTQDPNFVWMEDRTPKPQHGHHSHRDQTENQGPRHNENVKVQELENYNVALNQNSDEMSGQVKESKISHHGSKNNEVKSQHKNHKRPRHEYLESSQNPPLFNHYLFYFVPIIILRH